MKKNTIKKDKMKNPIKLPLNMMLIMLSVLPLIVAVSILSVISLYIVQGNMESSSENTLRIVANNLAGYCRDNKITAMTAQNYYEYLDGLKDNGVEMAIIVEDMPCATSIKNENDYRIREIEVERAMEDIDTENGFYDNYVEIDGTVYCGYYLPIITEGEVIGLAFAAELQENVVGAKSAIIKTFVLITIILIAVFVLITVLCSRGLIKTFAVVGRNVNALSKGDLRKQEEHTSTIREMSRLLQETQLTQENLACTIEKVKEGVQRLVTSISDVTDLSERSSERANRINDAMQELSDSTMSMTENVQDINEQMMEIGNCVNDISGNVDHLYKSSDTILHTNDAAQSSMNLIMENSCKSVEAVNHIADQIKRTNESIAQIDQAVALILSISEQTNLLSLNASIEAARVGVYGRGFAVVAEEIRNLSEQSAAGAEMIKDLANTITEMSMKSVQQVETVHSLIVMEQENVSNAQQKYEELSSNINLSVNEIKSIAEKTEHLTNYKERVIANVQGLSAISEQNAASNQEVCENVYEIMSAVQMVNTNCDKMNEMAGELEESVAYFR